jgi:hypothetical protein
VTNNIDAELATYDYLAIQYYYLGDLDKSRYYHTRMHRGKFEGKLSKIRTISEQ